MKKMLFSLIALLAVIAAIGWSVMTFFPEKLVPMLLNQQIKRLNQTADFFADKESITVYTVGTSSPLPGDRAQTGTAVIVNGHFFMFDVGDGVVQKAENFGLPLTQLDGIFITHWHSDHFIDLPALISRSWVLGRKTDLHVYGPDGLDTIMQSIHQFLSFENQHRVDHHGAAIMDISKARGIPHEFKSEKDGTTAVYEQDGIKITAFDADHAPIDPSVGYMIEYKGKKVVISGDTKKSDLVLKMSQDADLLIHEVLLASLLKQMSANLKARGNERNAKIIHDIQDYHAEPKEVAAIAEKAKVKKLVLHHFVPVPNMKIIENLYKKELTGYDGPIYFAKDGDKFIVN